VERMARDGSQFLNAHVFPGGQVEASDHGDIRRAALRELYEEVRLHLRPASDSTGRPRRVTPQAIKGDVPFPLFLEENKGPTAEESLIRYARWITPKMMPKRFDTHFFLGLCSDVDNPVDGNVDGQEIKSLAWLTPTEALSKFSSGKITLFPPQWYPHNLKSF
jgi:8-oxo-dGTP pyrophosphatase MutT (NUDIX family)